MAQSAAPEAEAPAHAPPSTTRAALRAAEARLSDAGCASPRLDAHLLLADALGVGRERLYLEPELALDRAAAERFAHHVGRRERREPIAYIVGRRAFRRLDLAVDRRVLAPRPDTELLVDVAISFLAHGAHVHDVGTGSGAVALALKEERPDLVVSASDASAGALAVARRNAARLGLAIELVLARDLPSAARRADLVVANLPYVSDDEWPSLAPEIRLYEPPAALLGGGPRGLDAIRWLIGAVPSGTPLALEHSPLQAAAVRALLAAPESCQGLGGAEDVTLGRVP